MQMRPRITFATDTCSKCQQPLELRPTIDGLALIWRGTDLDGTSTVGCMANPVDCELCGGTGDDPDDADWACETCDGEGVVNARWHTPTDHASRPEDAEAMPAPPPLAALLAELDRIGEALTRELRRANVEGQNS